MAIKFSDVRSEIEEHIKPNGVGAITGQVMQDAMMSLVDASEAEMSALNQEVDGKLTQLSQEFEELKEAEFNVMVQPHIEVIEPTDIAMAIEPDKFYKWGAVPSLALTLIAPNDGYAGAYLFQFTSPVNAATSLSLPVGIRWNETPNIEANKTYQVSILDSLAIITAWKE